MKDLASRAAAVLATLAGLFALFELRHAALLLLISIAVAASIEPAVQALVRLRLPRGVAIGALYALGLGMAALGIYAALRALPVEIGDAAGELRRVYGEVRTGWPAKGPLLRAFAERLPDPDRVLDGPALSSLDSGALGYTARVFGVGAEVGIVVALSILWSASAQPFELLWLSLLPAPLRARARRIWKALRDGVGKELRSALGQSILLAIAGSLIFRALGLPYPVLASLSIALLRLIPILGPALVLVVALLCGVSRGPLFGAAFVAGALVLLLFLRLVVAERLLGARRLHPLLAGVVLAALWEGGGLAALFLGAPIAAAVSILTSELAAPAVHFEPRTLLAHVADRVAELEGLLARAPAQRPELVNVAGRLAALVREAASTVIPLAPAGRQKAVNRMQAPGASGPSRPARPSLVETQ